MKPVKQTIFGRGKGNCLAACIASVLHLPLESVPNFCADYPESWWSELQKWLGERGFVALELFLRWDGVRVVAWMPPVYCILTGKSPRGDFLHCVVGRAGTETGYEPVHDPHPDDTFFADERPVRALFFVPKDPARLFPVCSEGG